MTDNRLKPKRGAPYGNQNARKHGFYSRALDRMGKKDLKQAATIEGVDEEIALIRLKLKSILQHDPENVRVIGQALLALNRLMRTRNRIGIAMSYQEMLEQAISSVLKEIALPLGVDLTKIAH